MAGAQQSDVDLKLLASLDAILQERSVSRAAVRLNLSQPSLSRALARLRAHFGDELLSRRGNAYELTPFAQSLSERTTQALSAVGRVFRSDSTFDAATLQREFSVFGSDYTHSTVGLAAINRAVEVAPGASFRFMNNGSNTQEDILHLLETNDAAMLPRGALPGLPSVEVLRDRWVWLVSTTNESVGDRLELQDLSRLPLVLTHQSKRVPSPAVRQLQMLGVEPQIACIVDGFLEVPLFVCGTDRVALAPSHLAQTLVRQGGLRAMECPYEAIGLSASLYWHPKFDSDPGHVWMRNLLADVGRAEFALDGPARPSPAAGPAEQVAEGDR